MEVLYQLSYIPTMRARHEAGSTFNHVGTPWHNLHGPGDLHLAPHWPDRFRLNLATKKIFKKPIRPDNSYDTMPLI